MNHDAARGVYALRDPIAASHDRGKPFDVRHIRTPSAILPSRLTRNDVHPILQMAHEGNTTCLNTHGSGNCKHVIEDIFKSRRFDRHHLGCRQLRASRRHVLGCDSADPTLLLRDDYVWASAADKVAVDVVDRPASYSLCA